MSSIPVNPASVSAARANLRAKASSWLTGGVLLAVLCLAVYLPGLWSIPPVDRDECRFAQASRQMFEAAALPAADLDLRTDAATNRPVGYHAGGWLVPMVQDRPRLNKPPLIYWLQVASAAAFTGGDPGKDAIWMYRVPSVLSAIIAVLATWRLGLLMFDPRAAWLAGALLAASPMVIWDAHQARADQLLLACTTLSMLALWRSITARSWLWPVALWSTVALGILAKGFITPMVVLLALGAFCAWSRSLGPLRRARPWLAVPIIALLVAPWLYLISQKFGLSEYARLVWDETFVRAAAGSKEGHFAPPGTHLVLLAALFWPGCFATAEGFARAARRAWGQPAGCHASAAKSFWALLKSALVALFRVPATGRRPELFLIAWIVPAWLIFELSLAKLPHYTLPLYPAVALISARAILSAALQRRLRALDPGLLIWTLAPAGLCIALLVMAMKETAPISLPLAGTALALSLGVPLLALARGAFRSGRAVSGQLIGLATLIWLFGCALQFVVPAFVPGHASSRIMDKLTWAESARGDGPPHPLASTYHEDSLIFHTRGRVQRITTDQLLPWLADNPRGIAITRLTHVPRELPDDRPLIPDARANLAIIATPGFQGPTAPN